jgi:hypothetical protein
LALIPTELWRSFETIINFKIITNIIFLNYELICNDILASYAVGPGGKTAGALKLTTHLHLVPRAEMVELYLHFPHVFMP